MIFGEHPSARDGNAEGKDLKLPRVMAAESIQDFGSAANPVDALETICRRFFPEAIECLGPFEWVTYTYLAWLEAIVILFHRNVAHAPSYVLEHFAIGAGTALLAKWATDSRNIAVQFARHWYPLPLYIFFFEELQGLVHTIFPGWFDRWLIQFDFNLAQVHPAVWLNQFANPTLNDAMQLAYMTYFLYLMILPGILYLEGKYAAFWTVMTATAIAHYSVYVIAILFPIESPYYSLASLNTTPLVGGPFTAMIDLIEHFGRVHGAAFPSAHVAGSMVALLAARRYKPWLYWTCLPFFVAMCVATVYGRYHYVADVIAGIAIGAIGWAAGQFLTDRREPGED